MGNKHGMHGPSDNNNNNNYDQPRTLDDLDAREKWALFKGR